LLDTTSLEVAVHFMKEFHKEASLVINEEEFSRRRFDYKTKAIRL